MASEGPIAIRYDAVRKIDGRALPPEVRAALEPLVITPQPRRRKNQPENAEGLSAKATWRLVPTGPLACGDIAFGTLVKTPPYDDRVGDDGLIMGCDMHQEAHAMSVRGESVAESYRWYTPAVDLSPKAHAGRTRRNPRGKYYLIGAYA
jgi:hypothetical protein